MWNSHGNQFSERGGKNPKSYISISPLEQLFATLTNYKSIIGNSLNFPQMSTCM